VSQAPCPRVNLAGDARIDASAPPAAVAQPLTDPADLETAFSADIEPPLPHAGHGLTLVRAELGDCQRCKLAKGRQHIVFAPAAPRRT